MAIDDPWLLHLVCQIANYSLDQTKALLKEGFLYLDFKYIRRLIAKNIKMNCLGYFSQF